MRYYEIPVQHISGLYRKIVNVTNMITVFDISTNLKQMYFVFIKTLSKGDVNYLFKS